MTTEMWWYISGGAAGLSVATGTMALVLFVRARRRKRRALSPWQAYLERERLRNERLAAEVGASEASDEEATVRAIEDMERDEDWRGLT